MTTFKITIAYDGTRFVGWQRQATGTSVQGLLEDALRELDGRDVAVTGAGRTDAGVHALGQVAGLAVERAINAETLVRALNARLPDDVRVLTAEEAAQDFHARYGACAKTYRYRIWNSPIASPFERAYTWHLPEALDITEMDAAARRLEGRHDFSVFRAAGGATRTTERTVMTSRVTRGADAAIIACEITGDGFLRHMVRNIVGTLVEIGRGRAPAAWIDDLLAARDRACAGPTAPSEGLFLVRVEYGSR